MRKLLVTLSWLLSCFFTMAQVAFSAKKITAGQVPSGLQYKGKLAEAWQWKDGLGANTLLLSTTDIEAGPGEDEQTIRLFAWHYCSKDTVTRLLWKLNDLVRQCPLDITAEFIKGSTSITDLDKDGVAETTILYKLACRGDVSPPDMKLIMHEDTVKYALRGSMWSAYANGDAGLSKFPITEKDVNLEKLPDYRATGEEYYKLYGRYQTEKDFKKAPEQFLVFARRQWLRFAIESFE